MRFEEEEELGQHRQAKIFCSPMGVNAAHVLIGHKDASIGYTLPRHGVCM